MADKGLVVECKRKTLFDSTPLSQTPFHTSSTPVSMFILYNDSFGPRVQLLPMQFPVLTSPLQLCNAERILVPVSHYVDDSDCSRSSLELVNWLGKT